jgi:hypothetical protein
MQSKYKVIVGSLAGAVAIHMGFVACGHAAHTNGQPGDAGAEVGIFDALVDQIASMMDGTTKDAKADTDGGACGCNVSGPIQSVPASENPAQLVRGSLASVTAAGSLVATGPFVLTDATAFSPNSNSGAWAALVLQPSAANCTALSGGADAAPGYLTTVETQPPLHAAVHGGRYVVPAGQMLCAFNPAPANNSVVGELQWAGFVPYQ